MELLHKTAVDDVGFYVVIKLRDDIEKGKRNFKRYPKRELYVPLVLEGQAISKKQRTI